jgi:HAD superfamily hydrolase (TIGR01509 family)
MKIEAVLFDCDGLMFNTEQISQRMWREEAAKYGTVIPDSFFRAITGAKRDEDFLSSFSEIPHLAKINAAQHEKRFAASTWTAYAPDGLNKKGLIELYQYLKKEKIKMAVCSSSRRDYVETLLSTVSIPMTFDALIGGDMVHKGKPDPEIFLTGAKYLHADRDHCLVLEDSKQGILAARNAGMHSCFIQDTIEPDEEMRSAIEYQKEDLSQVIDLLKEGEHDGIPGTQREI